MGMTREEKASKWLSREGFNDKGVTYVYYGSDSFAVKEELKKNGFRFNRILLWHTPNLTDVPYCAKTFEIHWSALLSMMAWGEGMYYENAEKIIRDRIETYNPKPASNSKYIEPVNNKIDVEAICTAHRVIETMYGLSNMFTFNAGEDVIVWFTSSNPDIEVGDSGELVGSFKKHETYNGVETTYITRAKLK